LAGDRMSSGASLHFPPIESRFTDLFPPRRPKADWRSGAFNVHHSFAKLL
jgi:hypothetical protein